jgi:tape measure domain-containing protein
MAVVADRVIVELEAKIDRYNADVRRAEGNFTRAMDRIGQSGDRTSRLVSTGVRTMAAAFAGVSAIALARQLLSMTDEAKKMDAQLRLATAAVGSFGQAQEDVRRIAAETRSDLAATSSLYSSFARGAKELGINQQQVADITTTVGQAFKVSGTSATDSAFAIRQLSQAFQSGVLRGDEFNSIMENAPRLARLLADSLNVPIGSLRAMAEEGELSADKLVAAFSDKKFTAALQAEFDQLPVTFDDAMTLVYNSALVTFSEFDRGGGFSQMLVQFITDGADGFGDLGDAARDMGIDVRATLAGLSDAFQPLFDGAMSVFGGIESEALTLRDRIRPLLADIDSISAWLAGPAGSIERRINEKVFGFKPTDLAGRFDRTYDQTARNRRMELGEQSVRDIFAGRDVFGNRTGGSPAGGSRPSGGAGNRTRGGRARVERSPLDPEAYAREEARLNAQILGERADLATTAEARADLELERLQAEQAQEAAETQTNEKFTDVQRARLVALQGAAYAVQRLAIVADRDREIAERTAEEREKQLRAEQGNARVESDALAARYDLAETSKERAAIESRLLDIAERQETAALEAEIAAGRIADAQRARADLAEAQAGRRTQSERDNEGPLARWRRDADRSAGEIEELAEQWVVDELDSVRDALRTSITDRLGVDDPVLNGLLDLFIEQVILKPIADRFAKMGTGGGFGAVGNFISSIFGSILGAPGRASGGHTVGGNFYRVTDGEGFQAAGSGKIIPLGRMRGAGGGHVTLRQTVNVDARGVNPEGFAEHIKSAVRQETMAIVGAGMKRVTATVPARMAQFERDGA